MCNEINAVQMQSRYTYTNGKIGNFTFTSCWKNSVYFLLDINSKHEINEILYRGAQFTDHLVGMINILFISELRYLKFPVIRGFSLKLDLN